MRVLVDTCVIIDALQSRVPFAEAAQKIFIYSANKQFEGYITAKSVTDIYYLTHRLTHSDAETRKILSKLFTLFHLLDTTSLDCRKAISSEIGGCVFRTGELIQIAWALSENSCDIIN